jgi:hypothetical protein
LASLHRKAHQAAITRFNEAQGEEAPKLKSIEHIGTPGRGRDKAKPPTSVIEWTDGTKVVLKIDARSGKLTRQEVRDGSSITKIAEPERLRRPPRQKGQKEM